MNILKQHTVVLITLFATLVMTALPAQAALKSDNNKVLMVVSGNDQGDKQPGYEFDDFSKADTVFIINGIVVDIVSPKGGPVEADKYNPSNSYNAKVLVDKAITAKPNFKAAQDMLKTL
ncbi:hypothetical protein [Colwellia sp. Bg11-28]|jgi:hypothetical protein|uniref:hypothetical protein n=1 Tax=Colwellia sp. Bg11-28 TaxID=2058305 RepID=UPI000C323594|nr:hypothetical protein [Colwellia sp. Bg11-28]PKH87519.1 hypothetical protein CXF79_12785 [Colwellia sp. Bg11-28]